MGAPAGGGCVGDRQTAPGNTPAHWLASLRAVLCAGAVAACRRHHQPVPPQAHVDDGVQRRFVEVQGLQRALSCAYNCSRWGAAAPPPPPFSSTLQLCARRRVAPRARGAAACVHPGSPSLGMSGKAESAVGGPLRAARSGGLRLHVRRARTSSRTSTLTRGSSTAPTLRWSSAWPPPRTSSESTCPDAARPGWCCRCWWAVTCALVGRHMR